MPAPRPRPSRLRPAPLPSLALALLRPWDWQRRVPPLRRPGPAWASPLSPDRRFQRSLLARDSRASSRA
ncbi:Hypothetical predicted protein, partial [Lynx pardinus]